MSIALLQVLSFTFLLLGLAYVVGRICYIAIRLKHITTLHHAAAPIVGLCAMATQLWLYGLVHIPWNALLLLAPWIILALLFRSSLRPSVTRAVTTLKRVDTAIKGLDRLSKILLALGVIFAFSYLLRLAVEPLTSSDTMAFWALKAKEFFFHQAVYVDPYLNSSYEVGRFFHVDYPPLWPLMADVSYVLLGHTQEAIQKTTSWIFCITAAVAVWTFAKERIGDTSKAIVIAFIMLAAPQFLTHLFVGSNMAYGDYPLAVMMLFSALFLQKSLMSVRPDSHWLFALFFASMASVIKNEGVAFLVIVGLILATRYLIYMYKGRHEQRVWRAAMGALGITVIILLPNILWMIYKTTHNLAIEFHLSNVASSGMSIAERLSVIGNTAYTYLWHHPIYWWQVGAIILGVLVAIWKRTQAIIVALFLVLAMLGSYLLSYVFSPHELQYHVSTSIDRLLSQVLPLMIVLLVVSLETRSRKISDKDGSS